MFNALNILDKRFQMFAALVALIHKTELPGDQVLDVLATCCLPQLLGHLQQMKNKTRIK